MSIRHLRLLQHVYQTSQTITTCLLDITDTLSHVLVQISSIFIYCHMLSPPEVFFYILISERLLTISKKTSMFNLNDTNKSSEQDTLTKYTKLPIIGDHPRRRVHPSFSITGSVKLFHSLIHYPCGIVFPSSNFYPDRLVFSFSSYP